MLRNLNIILPFIFLLKGCLLFSQISLPKLISDGMVLQRDTELCLWGYSSAGENIQLQFNGILYKTTANKTGKWKVNLPPQKAGGPFSMTFKGKNFIKVTDVLFGDVWVCSGQSNMQLPMERIKEKYPEIVSKAENTEIRQFLVPISYDFKEEHKDFTGGDWRTVTPANVLDFSAVAFFFADELYKDLNVPIGLINASVGGSPVEAWLSESTLKDFPHHYNEAQKYKNDSLIEKTTSQEQAEISQWYTALQSKDKGIAKDWKKEKLDDSDWKTIEIPNYIPDNILKEEGGMVWFRKYFNLPKNMKNKEAYLYLGRLVDQDSTYVNGKFIGTTGYQYPPRRYKIPTGILKEDENSISVKLIIDSGNGGFVPDKEYYISTEKDTFDLSGDWKYQKAASVPVKPSQTFIRWKPMGLYNAMIAPLLDYTVKGVIWYQGESNTDDPEEYSQLFPALIKSWRKNWKQENLPFLYVQLANFMETKDLPSESSWAELREVQKQTLSLPNTGMAVTIDLGEWNDIHPLNKKDVGKRLALQAKKIVYKDTSIIGSGPFPEKWEFNDNKVTVYFKNVTEGLMIKNSDKLKHFAISNDGQNFYWAEAKIIDGNRVMIWSSKVKNPIVVRYAWADNPAKANLYNSEELPAVPFQINK